MTLPKNHPAWNSLLNSNPISPSLMVFTTERARCCVIVIEICSASSFTSFFVTDDSAPPSPLFALDWDGGAPRFAPRFGGERPRPAVSLATSSLDSLACAPLVATVRTMPAARSTLRDAVSGPPPPQRDGDDNGGAPWPAQATDDGVPDRVPDGVDDGIVAVVDASDAACAAPMRGCPPRPGPANGGAPLPTPVKDDVVTDGEDGVVAVVDASDAACAMEPGPGAATAAQK